MAETIGKKWSQTISAIYFMLAILVFITSCNSQDKKSKSNTIPDATSSQGNQEVKADFAQPIGEVIRTIFQDKSGNLWFGTNGEGVIRHDGNALEYFSINEGLSGWAVRAIVEDKESNLWFGTSGGITKYDGNSFTNFTEKDGLINNDVWSMAVDSKGIIWVGTLQGICRFNPASESAGQTNFTPFAIPEAQPDYKRKVTSNKIVHCIMEDSKGKMWFGTNGGAYIYDPSNGQKGLTNISKIDGLCNNAVNDILEDKDGNFWFATHHKGVCRMEPSVSKVGEKTFTQISSRYGVDGYRTLEIFEDNWGNIWFPMEGSGVYRHDPSAEPVRRASFTNFQKNEGLDSDGILCFLEDKEGRFWLGGIGGLFRYDPTKIGPGEKTVFSVTKNGPWQ